MIRTILLRGVSACALALPVISSHAAIAQESLPTIDVGAARRNTDRTAGPAAAGGGRSAPATAAEPLEKGYVVQNASSATKTNTPIRQTPVSVQVVPKAVLEDRQITDLDQAVTNVSGVQPDFGYGGNWNGFIIRGFSNIDNFQNSTMYRNGVRDFGRAGGAEETSNIERVEIVKGPNSALYGRIEPGGLVNIITKQPQATPHYELQQQLGSFGMYRTTADLTGPLTADGSVMYRLDGAFQKSQSFRDVLYNDYTFLAPSLKIRPNDDFEFNISYEKRNQYGPGDYGNPGLFPGVSRSLWVGDRHDNAPLDKDRINADFTYKFAKDWKFQAGIGSFHGHTHYTNVFNYGLDPTTGDMPLAPWVGHQAVHAKQGFAQVNGQFNTFGVKHDLLFGGDSLQDTTTFRYFVNGFAPIGTFNIYAPWATFIDYAALSSQYPDYWSVKSERWNGLFVQDQMTIMERVHLLAGVRYDWTQGSTSNVYNPKIATNSFSGAHPRFGLLVDVTDWASIYGSYSEALGAVNAGLDPLGNPFKSEEARQSEVGVKADFLDKRLSATLAFYHLTKTNVLQPAAGLGAALIYNLASGEVRSQGVEVDVIGKVTDQLSVIANYAHTDALVTKDINGFQGSRPANVAKDTFNFWTTYDVTKELKVGTGVYVTGPRPGILYNSNTPPTIFNKFDLPGYARWDAMAAYSFLYSGLKFTAQLNVYNITDTHYIRSSDTVDGVPYSMLLPGAPRSVLGSLKVEF